MALQDNAILTVSEAATYLGVGASDEPLLTAIINRVSDECESGEGANRVIRKRTLEDLRLPGQTESVLRLHWPIDVEDAVLVSLDGAALTVWRTEADGDPSTFNVEVCASDPGVPDHLYRKAGWTGVQRRPIVVTYTAGYEQTEIPGDLKDAAFLILEHRWRLQTKKLMDVASLGAGPVSPGLTFGNPGRIPVEAREILMAHRRHT